MQRNTQVKVVSSYLLSSFRNEDVDTPLMSESHVKLMKCHLCAEKVIFKTIPGPSGLTTKGIENKITGNVKDKYNFKNCITDKNKCPSYVFYSLNVKFFYILLEKKKTVISDNNKKYTL